jgi:hypothetical protein
LILLGDGTVDLRRALHRTQDAFTRTGSGLTSQ